MTQPRHDDQTGFGCSPTCPVCGPPRSGLSAFLLVLGLGLVVFMLSGCNKPKTVDMKDCVPCMLCAKWDTWDGCAGQVQEPGFLYRGYAGPLTQCIPCSKAKSAEQRFVCFGEQP